MALTHEIKRPKSRVFRRLWMKRRLVSTGLFESSWQDISADVKKWGVLTKSIDAIRYAVVTMSDMMVSVANDRGRYNPNDDNASLWFGYGDQQRTLIKVELGFLNQSLGANGIWTTTEFPTSSSIFFGIISGNINMSDKNEILLPVKPLTQVFRDYPARNLVGAYTTTGMTALKFLQAVRDHTDGSGLFVFRPFFQDTTTYWQLTSSSTDYTQLSTSTGKDIADASVWDIVTKLAEAEDLVPYVKNDGTFAFKNRDPNTTTAAFTFFGRGYFDTEYGSTIKQVRRYGIDIANYYSRVTVKYGTDTDTVTSLRVYETSLTVGGLNQPWNRGHRSFDFVNAWIPNSTVADTILLNIFSNVSSLKNTIEFSSSLIPHLDILDRIEINYESADIGFQSRWDLNNWAPGSNSSEDLVWASTTSDAISLAQDQFKLTKIAIDLDNLETVFTGIHV